MILNSDTKFCDVHTSVVMEFVPIKLMALSVPFSNVTVIETFRCTFPMCDRHYEVLSGYFPYTEGRPVEMGNPEKKQQCFHEPLDVCMFVGKDSSGVLQWMCPDNTCNKTVPFEKLG
jgi:hypothetical protein